MAIEETTEVVFKASDGTSFSNKAEAEQYEAILVATPLLEGFLKQYEGKSKRSISLVRNHVTAWEKWKAAQS